MSVVWGNLLDEASDQRKRIHMHEWDNLLILDGCRYDAFEEVYPDYLTGSLEKARSPASCTRDWLRGTWIEDYPDVTYISDNPFIGGRIYEGKGHVMFPRIKAFKEILDVFLEAMDAETVNKYALMTEGRRVIHYAQPLRPMLGEVKTEDKIGYMSNLRYVLRHVTEILPKLDGVNILTADHGVRFNGMVRLHHPCNRGSPELRLVPWFKVEEIK